jgi:hypothetical protein
MSEMTRRARLMRAGASFAVEQQQMNNVRRGERATFAGLFVLSAGALCVALTACSSGSDSGGALGGWGGTASSNGNGNGASGSTSPTGGNAGSGGGSGSGGATTTGGDDASTPSADAGARASGDGGGGAVVDAGPMEDTGSPANTFSLINTNVTTLVDGEGIYGYDPIAENSAINLAQVGTALSIRANTTPSIVDHVYFVMDGTYTHTENAAPYTLCGDNGNGTITSCIQYFTSGNHTLTITVYALTDAGPGADAGPPLSTSTLYFSVTNSEAGAPDAGGG